MQQPVNLKLVRIKPLFGFIKAFFSSKSHLSSSVKTMFFSVLILVINMLTGILTARFLSHPAEESRQLWFYGHNS